LQTDAFAHCVLKVDGATAGFEQTSDFVPLGGGGESRQIALRFQWQSLKIVHGWPKISQPQF
jgi:hypothetical protein